MAIISIIESSRIKILFTVTDQKFSFNCRLYLSFHLIIDQQMTTALCYIYIIFFSEGSPQLLFN